MPAAAAKLQGARHENLGERRAASFTDATTRTMLLAAKEGEMIPPSLTSQGIELMAVCGRKVVKVEIQKREQAAAKLRQEEFEVLARRHLMNLRQESQIEHR